jgi:cellulose synthase/poly-beta-1,6-N-acetylglucosamine synthase-like glycosyltransferase
MSTAPGVSFVVTVYNKAPFLPLVTDALFAQTGDFEREFIIIDDGSTDGSWELLQRLASAQRNVTLLRQANAGPAVATNVAVRAATLPWLKIVDADDVLAPRCTKILLDAAMSRGLQLAVGRRAVSYRLGCPIDYGACDLARVTVRRQGFFAACLTNVPCNLSATLIDRALYWGVGGCDERIFTQDYSLLLRLSWRSDAAEVDGVGLMASPIEAPGRLSGNQRNMLRDTNLAIMLFLAETPGIAWRHRHKAIERAFGRAWKWQRRKLGAGFRSRWFWLYALAKAGPPGLAMPLLPLTLAAFAEPSSAAAADREPRGASLAAPRRHRIRWG